MKSLKTRIQSGKMGMSPVICYQRVASDAVKIGRCEIGTTFITRPVGHLAIVKSIKLNVV